MAVHEIILLNQNTPVNIPSGLVPKGAYAAGTDYAVGDSVDYQGSSYVMFIDAAAGTLPTDTTKWQVLANKGATGATGSAGADGTNGTDGASAFVYIAYASADDGTGFTMTFDAALNYVAILETATAIPAPAAGDFAGLWKNYKGATGATGPAGTSGHTIKDEGTPLTARTNLNFVGAGVTATDDAGNDQTIVTISGGAGSGDVIGPATNTDAYIPQWNGANSKTLKDGLAVPAGGLAGLTALGGKEDVGVAASAVSTHSGLTTGVHGVGAGTVAKTADITATKLDDFATPDANTDLNANTTNHGLLLQATAPAAGLTNIVAIENGETIYKNKALFDATSPSTQNFADAAVVGTAVVAARRDHKHAMMAAPTSVTGNAGTVTNGVYTTSDATVLAATAAGDKNKYLHSNSSTGVLEWSAVSGSGASTSLDNLASVAINTSLISDTNSTDDLGSSSKYWANTYTDSLHLTAGTTTVAPIMMVAGTNLTNPVAGVIEFDGTDLWISV